MRQGVDAGTGFSVPGPGRISTRYQRPDVAVPVGVVGWEYHFRRAGRMFTLGGCDQ